MIGKKVLVMTEAEARTVYAHHLAEQLIADKKQLVEMIETGRPLPFLNLYGGADLAKKLAEVDVLSIICEIDGWDEPQFLQEISFVAIQSASGHYVVWSKKSVEVVDENVKMVIAENVEIRTTQGEGFFVRNITNGAELHHGTHMPYWDTPYFTYQSLEEARGDFLRVYVGKSLPDGARVVARNGQFHIDNRSVPPADTESELIQRYYNSKK